MEKQTTQSLENHAVSPTSLIVCVALMLAGVIMALVGLILVKHIAGTCLIGTGLIFNGFGGLYALIVIRGYATKLQDRIIRTETRIRLEKILPTELQGRIPELTVKQLIGLRFGSDEEMPGLVPKVLDAGIQSAGTIKQMVKDWQADDYRV